MPLINIGQLTFGSEAGPQIAHLTQMSKCGLPNLILIPSYTLCIIVNNFHCLNQGMKSKNEFFQHYAHVCNWCLLAKKTNCVLLSLKYALYVKHVLHQVFEDALKVFL